MRILLINPYGTLPSDDWREYRTARLLRILLNKGHEVLWITTNYDSRQNKFRERSYHPSIYLVKAGGFSRNISFRRLFFEWRYSLSVFLHILKSKKYDVINITSPSMIYGLILALLQKAKGGKVTFDVIDLWPEHFYTFLSKLKSKLFFPIIFMLKIERSISFLIADFVFFCSEEYSSEAGRSIKKEKKRVRYIGSDYDDLKNVLNHKKNTNNICRFLYAGTFGESYDVQSLVRATENLIHEGYEFEICFAGDGPLKDQVVELAKVNPKYVRFVGLLGPERLSEELLRADVGLSCYAKNSRVSMPLKFYDYISNHIYIINSLTGEVNNWLEDLEVGVLYEAGNILSLKSAMEQAIINKVWSKIDWGSKEKALDRFDANKETEKMANELVNLSTITKL